MNQTKKQQVIKRFNNRKKQCPFIVNGVTAIDYRSVDSYKRYITDRGKIMPRRNTGVSAKFQRRLAEAVKRARYMGLIPYEQS